MGQATLDDIQDWILKDGWWEARIRDRDKFIK
jgi:hypothetical protein